MAQTSPSTEALRTLRQRGSIVLGVLAMICCLGLVVTSVTTQSVSPVFDGAMLFGAALGWVLFVRPSLVISLAGVHLNNPLRRTLVPWSRVADVATRWNLEVYTDADAVYPAWAIATHIERPKGSGLLGLTGAGRRAMADSEKQPRPSSGPTVHSAAASIDLARDEWSEMLAAGRPEVVPDAPVTRSWDLLDLACLGVPLIIVAAGLSL